MKESLLTQLKRNLSNRSKKGKETQQRPETPDAPRFLDVDGDARSTYSVESDSKSFFSFSFENTDSKSLCDFETTAYGGTKSTRKFLLEKADDDACPPPPYDIDRLEWIIFYPEGPGKHLVGMLGINDVVALSQVCRAWRRWLLLDRGTVGSSSENSERAQASASSSLPLMKGYLRWHPLLRTVIVATPPPSQGSRGFMEPLGFYGRYHRQSIVHWQKYEFSIPRLLNVFGKAYISAISVLHLDGAALDSKVDWLRYCANLEILSIRKCAGITLHQLGDILLGPENKEAGTSRLKKQKATVPVPRPESLRTLRFWGIDGARQLAYPYNSDQMYPSDRQKLERLCAKLMRRYETDVSWGYDGDRVGSKPFSTPAHKLLISLVEPCGVCGRARKDLGWEDGVTCERCLGFICTSCLNIRAVSKEGNEEAHDLSDNLSVNMLKLTCDQHVDEDICGWEGGEHHVHPECIPPASLLWGHNDPLKHVFELYAHLQKRSNINPS